MSSAASGFHTEPKHIKTSAWTQASLCGVVYNAEMRRRELDGTQPDCAPCLRAFLKLPRLGNSQRRWAEGLLAAAVPA